MSKAGKLMISMVTMLAVGMLLLSGSTDAGGGKDKDKDKAKPKISKALAKVINATDPEIKAAQDALRVALKDLIKARGLIKKAMEDEVFSEKGDVEAAALNRLKQALKACDNSIADCNASLKLANLAQSIDKGKD